AFHVTGVQTCALPIFEYMDRFMLKMIQLVNDSVPEKSVNMVNTSPGFSGSGSANTGMMRIGLVPPENRERSQEEIAEALTRQTRSEERRVGKGESTRG